MFQLRRLDKKGAGFTLAELLVVIAIISLLSSIVLVSVSKTRGKAKTAKNLLFASSIYHALGDSVVGIWNFDEGVEGQVATGAQDSSGYNNHGSCTYCPTWQCDKEDTPSGKGCSLYFTGGQWDNKYIEVPDSPSLNPKEITMEAWVYLTDYNSWFGSIIDKTFVDRNQYWLRFYADSGRIMGYINTGGNKPFGYRFCWAAAGKLVPLNEWSHLLFTYDGTNGKVYVNGEVVCTYSAGDEDIVSDTAPLRIGAFDHTYNGFRGYIDEVKIYERALDMDY